MLVVLLLVLTPVSRSCPDAKHCLTATERSCARSGKCEGGLTCAIQLRFAFLSPAQLLPRRAPAAAPA